MNLKHRLLQRRLARYEGQAPDFELPDQDGSLDRLSDLVAADCRLPLLGGRVESLGGTLAMTVRRPVSMNASRRSRCWSS
jgi:hypothetical protein